MQGCWPWLVDVGYALPGAFHPLGARLDCAGAKGSGGPAGQQAAIRGQRQAGGPRGVFVPPVQRAQAHPVLGGPGLAA